MLVAVQDARAIYMAGTSSRACASR